MAIPVSSIIDAIINNKYATTTKTALDTAQPQQPPLVISNLNLQSSHTEHTAKTSQSNKQSLGNTVVLPAPTPFFKYTANDDVPELERLPVGTIINLMPPPEYTMNATSALPVGTIINLAPRSPATGFPEESAIFQSPQKQAGSMLNLLSQRQSDATNVSPQVNPQVKFSVDSIINTLSSQSGATKTLSQGSPQSEISVGSFINIVPQTKSSYLKSSVTVMPNIKKPKSTIAIEGVINLLPQHDEYDDSLHQAIADSRLNILHQTIEPAITDTLLQTIEPQITDIVLHAVADSQVINNFPRVQDPEASVSMIDLLPLNECAQASSMDIMESTSQQKSTQQDKPKKPQKYYGLIDLTNQSDTSSINESDSTVSEFSSDSEDESKIVLVEADPGSSILPPAVKVTNKDSAKTKRLAAQLKDLIKMYEKQKQLLRDLRTKYHKQNEDKEENINELCPELKDEDLDLDIEKMFDVDFSNIECFTGLEGIFDDEDYC